MKKVLLSILAVAALASCVQTEELQGIGGNNAIKFDNAYVGNATKAIDNSFDNSNLELFQVYGTLTDADGDVANIFDGVEVSKETGTWTYAEEHTKYWIAGNTYSFKAVAAGNEPRETNVVWDDEHLMPKAIEVLDASAQNDVLYAEVLGVNYIDNLQPVKFTFEHLLAKAKVSVKETAKIVNGGYYVVTNVYLKDTHKAATYTIGAGWAGWAEAYDLEFGNIVDVNADKNTPADALQLPLGTGAKGASHYERLIIPQNDCELTIVVDYTYYNNGLAQQTVENKEIKTVANIESGKAYNFVLALAEPGEPITFDVEAVTDWVEGGIKTAADLKDAVAAGGTVFLAKDIDLGNEQLVVPAGKSVVLNLNGHTVSQTKACTESYEMISNKGNLTIMGNGKLSFKDTSAGDPTFGWGSYTIRNEGTLVVEDGVIEHLGEQNFATHMICAIFQYSGSTTINGGTISTPNYRSARLWKGDMTINGGKFNGQVWVHAVDDSAVLTINGGNFAPSVGDGSSVFVTNADYTVNLAVNGGYFNTKIGTSNATKAGVKGTIKGGSFTESAKANTNAALLATGYGFVATEGGSLWNVEMLPVVAKDAVELLAAVNQVADGGTITLSADFNFTTEEGGYYNNGGWKDGLGYSGDKSFTLDLNGHTLGNANGALNDYLVWFKNDGEKPNTITIKNGILDAGTAAYCALCTASSNKQTITVNLENVNLINNNSNGSTVKVRGGAVLNVKAGTKITGKNSYLGIECVASTTNIYDGAEIYMNGTSSYNGCLVGACGIGVVNVYGGYGKGAKGGFIAMTSGGTINVAGGEWIANTDGTIGNNSNLYVLTAQNNKNESGYAGASIINVTGGTLRGGMDAWVLNDVTVEKAELNISGGNFNANPTHYLTDGATAAESNGTWTVTAK